MALQSAEEKTATGNWLARLCTRLETYETSDPAPFGPLILAFCMYAFILFAMGSRLLWHDELYTYYIAKTPTLARFIAAATEVELQPPMQYVLSRLSMRVLGDSALGNAVTVDDCLHCGQHLLVFICAAKAGTLLWIDCDAGSLDHAVSAVCNGSAALRELSAGILWTGDAGLANGN